MRWTIKSTLLPHGFTATIVHSLIASLFHKIEYRLFIDNSNLFLTTDCGLSMHCMNETNYVSFLKCQQPNERIISFLITTSRSLTLIRHETSELNFMTMVIVLQSVGLDLKEQCLLVTFQQMKPDNILAKKRLVSRTLRNYRSKRSLSHYCTIDFFNIHICTLSVLCIT